MGTRRWPWLVKLAISAALVSYILWRVPWPEIRSSLVSARPWAVGLAIILSVPVVWLLTLQMKLLFDAVGGRLSTATVLLVNLTTEFYAFFLPGYALAGALRWYRFTKRGIPSIPALSVLVYNRLISVTCVALTGVLFLWLDPPPQHTSLLASLLVGTFLVVLALHVLAFRPALALNIGDLASRKAGPTLAGRIAGRLAELSQATQTLGSLPAAGRLTIYRVCLVRQVISIATFHAFAVALSLGISPVNSGFARAVAILLTLIPVSFAGIGVREGGLIYVLTRFGVAPASAVAFSFLLLGRDLLIRLVGGVLELRLHLQARSRP